MIKSPLATATASVSAVPVVVVIPMPEEKATPFANSTFAADPAGITKEKNTLDPAVGVPDVLWKATFRAAAFALKI